MATREKTDAAILKTLEVIEKRVAKEAAGLAEPIASTDDPPRADAVCANPPPSDD